jgi:hypothetical protein
MVTEMVKGKTLQEALEVSNKTVAEALGGLPPAKMHCSNLAADALHIAIDDYLDRSGVAVRDTVAERAHADAEADSLECCQEAGVATCTLHLPGLDGAVPDQADSPKVPSS